MTNYPLAWPAGWPRKTDAQRADARFGRKDRRTVNYTNGGSSSWTTTKAHTVSDGVKRVMDELARLGARRGYTVISTNVVVRLDGLPRSGQREPADPGAAVYWQDRTGAPRVMAIDQYRAVADNLAAMAATLEALRAIARRRADPRSSIHGLHSPAAASRRARLARGHRRACWRARSGRRPGGIPAARPD